MEEVVGGVWRGIISIRDGIHCLFCAVLPLIRCQNLLQHPSALWVYREFRAVVQQGFHVIPKLSEPIIVPAVISVQGLAVAEVRCLLRFISVERGVVKIHGRCLNSMYIRRFWILCRGLVPVCKVA